MASRYDIVYGGAFYAPTCHVAPHFCREWDDDGGCYGTNPHHGLAWDEARKIVADWHRMQAESWEKKSEDDYYSESPDSASEESK